jgi:DNA (cytosine-5)-methyltransferase 1
MHKLRSGEVCAGYGGLARAIEQVFNAEPAWFSEFDDAPSKILAHHWPTVPNHGDMTLIDWAAIEHVDVIGGGTPCQDLSHAGTMAGMTTGTRSNLAVEMLRAVRIQQPKYVVWENVRGSYTAKADSDLEHCPGCMGDPRDARVVLRALGRLLGSLSDLGYDAEWRGLRASDVGAPHPRYRVFVLAVRRDAIPDAGRLGREKALEHDGRRAASIDWSGLLDESGRNPLRFGPFGGWGEYDPAVRRWESVTGRPAPSPVERTGRGGTWQLSARFCEWLMGAPDGWITDPAIGISRNDQLKACGNGVVEHQAVAALRDMLRAFAERESLLEVAA